MYAAKVAFSRQFSSATGIPAETTSASSASSSLTFTVIRRRVSITSSAATARSARVEPGGVLAKLGLAIGGEHQLGRAVADRCQVAKPGADQREPRVERLGPAPAGRPLPRLARLLAKPLLRPLVGRVLRLVGERVEPVLHRVADLAAPLLGGLQQPLPRRVVQSSRARRPGERLRAGAQLAPALGEQKLRPLEVAAGKPRGGAELAAGPPLRVSAARRSSTASGPSAANAISRQRERTVSSSADGCDEIRIRCANGAGSSSVFSSAFWLSSAIASASLDHEDAPLALERPVGRRLDHALANLVDQVLRAGRAKPREVRVRRGVGERPAPGRVRVGRPGRKQLGDERPRRRPLPGPGGPGEEVGVRRALERGGEGHRAPRLVLGGGREGLGQVGHRPRTTSSTRACTSSGDPVPSTTTIRSAWRSASSS